MIFRILIFTLALQVSCVTKRTDSALQSSARKKGDFRGYFAIDSLLKGKISDENFSLQYYVPGGSTSVYDGKLEGLHSLLGSYDGYGEQNSASQSTPNSSNTLIWYLTLKNLAQSIANNCGEGNQSDSSIQTVTFNEHFQQSFTSICEKFKRKEVLTKAEGQNVWYSIMDFKTPESEFGHWLTFTNQTLSSTSERSLVDIYLAMLINPYFLLVI